MNKKFYGTLLLGTLLLGSTIVSCKDYDDDIDNLQNQITQLATKADLESKVSALESSLSAAKASAESAVKTATQALADAKAAADKANSASDAAGAAQDAADKAAAAVKAAEEALAAAEKKVAAIEEQLAAVETLKADLQAYTEAEIKNLKTQIASDIDALKEEVQGLVGLHYVDLMMSNATPNASTAVVSSEKFTPKTNDKYYKIFKAKFPELADLEGTTVINTAKLNVLVSPADAEMKSEYTYELIDMNQEAVALEVANPVKGLTRASGSEYWSLEVAPTFNEKGKINIVANANYALRVSEGTEEIYKTAFEFEAQSGKVAANELNAKDATVAYAEEIDLVNDIIVDADDKKDGIFDSPVIGITNGLKDYYIITINDNDKESFELEKYGVSIDGSKLTIANMPANVNKFSIKYSVMALFSDGEVKRTTEEKTLTIVQKAETMATLESKQITLGDAKTYTLRYSVDSLGLTPSQLADLAGSKFSIKNDEGKVLGNVAVDAMVSKTTTGKLDELTKATAKTAKYIGFTVNDKQLKELVPGNYTVVLSKTDDVVVVYSAEGDLEAVNSGVVIKLIEALCDEDGVLQAVGAVDTDNKVVTYDVKRALILKGAKLIDPTTDKPVMEDLDETVDNLSWVMEDKTNLTTTFIKVHVNDDKAGYNDINNTVRNLRLNYYIEDTSEDNVEAFDFQVKMMSAVYSEDPTQVITVANKSIYFTPTKDVTPADNKFDITSVVTKAVFACGNQAGQEYRLFQGFKTIAKADPVYLVDYTTPHTALHKTYKANGKDAGDVNLLSDKDGNLKAISVEKLKENELIDANEAFYAEATEFYLAWNSTTLYYKYSKDGVVKIKESKATLSKTLQALNNAWFDKNPYDIATTTKDQVKNALIKWKTGGAILKTGTTGTYSIYEWVFGETKNMSKEAKQFEALRGDLKFKDFTEKYSAAPIDKESVVPDPEKEPAGEIESVEIKFNDKELAEKFVETPTSWNNTDLRTKQITVKARQDYDPSQLVDNQITLDATITIKDVWGMKMEVPFQVTCKVNPNK